MVGRKWWNLYETLAWVLYRDRSFAEHRFAGAAGRENWASENVYRGGPRRDPNDPDGVKTIELVVRCAEPWRALDEAIQADRVPAHRFRTDEDGDPPRVSAGNWAARGFGSWRDADGETFLFRPNEVMRAFPAPAPAPGARNSVEREVLGRLKALMAEREKVEGESRETLWRMMAPEMKWATWILLWAQSAAEESNNKSWGARGPGRKPTS